MDLSDEHVKEAVRTDRYPVRWMTYKRRLQEDLRRVIRKEGGKEFFSNEYISTLSASVNHLEVWEIKLLGVQFTITAFLVLGYVSSDSAMTFFSISIKQTPGIKELLLTIASSISVLSLIISGAKDTKLTIIEEIIKENTEEEFIEFAQYAAPSSFNVRVYIVRQFEDWIFPTWPTKITSAVVIILLSLVFIVFILSLMAFNIYVYIDIYNNPTMGMWSYYILIYVLCIFILSFLWLFRMHFPLPFRDKRALKALAELEKTDPSAYKKYFEDLCR